MSNEKLGPDEDPRDVFDVVDEIKDMYETEMGYDREDGGTYPSAVVATVRQDNRVLIKLRNGSEFFITVERAK